MSKKTDLDIAVGIIIDAQAELAERKGPRLERTREVLHSSEALRLIREHRDRQLRALASVLPTHVLIAQHSRERGDTAVDGGEPQ